MVDGWEEGDGGVEGCVVEDCVRDLVFDETLWGLLRFGFGWFGKLHAF